MDIYSGHINKLIEQLSRLPGVGAKSAQRLAFHIINMPQEEVEKLTRTMLDAKANIRYCKECFTLTDKDLCPICANQARDHKTIMVVEHTRDMAAYEKTGKYEGVYHVLHGIISPRAFFLINGTICVFSKFPLYAMSQPDIMKKIASLNVFDQL